MWYVIIMFIIIFEVTISVTASYFPQLIVSAIDYESMAESGTSVVELASNPISMFADIITFQVQGAEIFSIIFAILNVLLIICIIKLIAETVGGIL